MHWQWLSRRRLLWLAAVMMLLLMSVFSAMSAANSVPPSGLALRIIAPTPDQFRPPQCTGSYINLRIATNGNNQTDLILGTAGNDTLDGNQGNDCMIGGAGDDTLNGNPGNDILVGGAGTDTLNGGGGTDTCYGTVGTDTFNNCESTINTP